MIKSFFYLLLIAFLGLGFAWLGGLGGNMVIEFEGQRIALTLVKAGAIGLALFCVLLFAWWVIKSIFNAPALIKRRWQERRKDRGYQLLSSGLIAAFSGDADTALRMARKSGKLLDGKKELLVPFLEAQAKLLDSDDENAVKLFESMRQNPQTRLVGLKGLYRAALDSSAPEAAAQYAAEAAALNPGLKWASLATIDRFAARGEWQEALTLFDNYAKTQPKTFAGHARFDQQRAVLLTGQAREVAEKEPAEARYLALQAHKLVPAFIPAATTAAQILFALGEMRKASRLVNKMWKETPHPDLGLVYINAEASSAAERLKRAKNLARHNPSNRESRLLIARTAFEAGELALAREQAELVAQTAPSEGVFLLLADIETRQTGDQGKIRHWLSKAVQAEPDMTWIGDDISLPEWQAVSPVSGHLGGCQWRRPNKRQNSLHHVFDKDTRNPYSGQRGEMAVAANENPAPGESLSAAVLDITPEYNTDTALAHKAVASNRQNAAPLTRLVVDDPGVDDTEEIK